MPLKTQKQWEADHRATATAMIVSDMREAGFWRGRTRTETR
jgi:hypothetical protein